MQNKAAFRFASFDDAVRLTLGRRGKGKIRKNAKIFQGAKKLWEEGTYENAELNRNNVNHDWKVKHSRKAPPVTLPKFSWDK